MKTSTLVVTAAAAALAAGTALAQCDARLQEMQARHGEVFTGEDAGLSAGRPVLRDLRDAAIRLQQQGLDDACERVVDALETTIAAYRRFGARPPVDAPAETAEVAPPAAGGSAPAENAEVAPPTTGGPAPATVGPRSAEPVVATGDGTTAAAGTTAGTTPQEAATRVAARPVVTSGQVTPEQVQQRAIPLTRSDLPLNTDGIQDQDVYSYQGEYLGDFEGLLISPGQPGHVIISHDGAPNAGLNDVAVPVNLVAWDPEWQTFVVPFNRAQLEGAPDYDREAGANWDWTGNNRYWGQFRG